MLALPGRKFSSISLFGTIRRYVDPSPDMNEEVCQRAKLIRIQNYNCRGKKERKEADPTKFQLIANDKFPEGYIN